MYGPINVFEIISDYFNHMREDFKPVPLIITLILIPFILEIIFYLSIKEIERLYGDLITVSSILIPLLLNLLMIVYYSLEKTGRKEKDKILFLSHLNSTISMTILTTIFILILSLLLTNVDRSLSDLKLIKLLNFILLYAIGFLIINVLITLVRIYRLIRYEIRVKGIENDCVTD